VSQFWAGVDPDADLFFEGSDNLTQCIIIDGGNVLKAKKIFAICLFGVQALLTVVSALAQDIPVGVLLPLSGKLALVGNMEKLAFQMAADQLQASSELGGHRIVLHFRDTAGDPDTAKSAAQALIAQDGVVLLTGGCSSTAALEAAKVAQEHEVPFLITTASADRLTEIHMKYVFRLCLPVSEYSRPMAWLLGRFRGQGRAAILREESRYGHYETRSIVRVCRRTRLIITDILSYLPTSGQDDSAPYFPRLQEASPDVLFIISRDSEAVRALALSSAMYRQPRLVICKGEPFLAPKTYLEAQVRPGYVFTTAPWHENAPYPGSTEFAATFFKINGFMPDYHAAQAYAAFQVIINAISRSPSPDPQAIQEALDETEMMSIYGSVRFQSYGDKKRQNRPPMVLLRWSGEKLEPVSYSP